MSNINTPVINADTLKLVRTHARMSNALVLALQDFSDTQLTDKQKVRATNAAATIGTKMLAVKNALPSDPSKLRMHVESIKQKVNAIVSALPTDKTFKNHCERAAIIKSAKVALENCDTFIKEYQEMKGTALAAKAA